MHTISTKHQIPFFLHSLEKTMLTTNHMQAIKEIHKGGIKQDIIFVLQLFNHHINSYHSRTWGRQCFWKYGWDFNV
jgi:hypothetical protein